MITSVTIGRTTIPARRSANPCELFARTAHVTRAAEARPDGAGVAPVQQATNAGVYRHAAGQARSMPVDCSPLVSFRRLLTGGSRAATARRRS
jgi:hypothetical protein